MLKSMLCREETIRSASFLNVESELKTRQWFKLRNMPNAENIIHRKSWEFSYITLALRERGMLSLGKKGLGFAVGLEPLPSFFASQGCEIHATDLSENSPNARGWIRSQQNLGGGGTR